MRLFVSLRATLEEEDMKKILIFGLCLALTASACAGKKLEKKEIYIPREGRKAKIVLEPYEFFINMVADRSGNVKVYGDGVRYATLNALRKKLASFRQELINRQCFMKATVIIDPDFGVSANDIMKVEKTCIEAKIKKVKVIPEWEENLDW